MPMTLWRWGPTRRFDWHLLTVDMRLGRGNVSRREETYDRVFLFTRRCLGPFAFTYVRELKAGPAEVDVL
jgi:hypothetical protein